MVGNGILEIKALNFLMSKKRKIRVIIFDLGGVLVHGGYLEFIRQYCTECLTLHGQKEIKKLERQVNLGEISEREFYRRIEKVFGVHLTPHQMHELIVRKMRADRNLVRLIPNLKRSKIVLFTNSIGRMAIEVLRRRKIPARKLFDRVFISSTLRLVKPDRKAYEYILKQVKAKPSETLLVDDRPLNVLGARKFGMQGLVYKNFKYFRRAIQKYEFV